MGLFYIFVLRLISVEISDDSSLLAAGFADSNIRIWTLTPKKLRSIKPADVLQELEKEAEDVMERIMDERFVNSHGITFLIIQRLREPLSTCPCNDIYQPNLDSAKLQFSGV